MTHRESPANTSRVVVPDGPTLQNNQMAAARDLVSRAND